MTVSCQDMNLDLQGFKYLSPLWGFGYVGDRRCYTPVAPLGL